MNKMFSNLYSRNLALVTAIVVGFFVAAPAASTPKASDVQIAPSDVLIAATGPGNPQRPGSPSTDAYRPAYHFTPARNWINDPNGLVYLDAEYHLFYQYNPFGDRWGHMSWGHAISRDLVHWQELPVAIPEDQDYMIFSGSIVVDERNTSGFGKDGGAPLVAVYTGYQRSAAKIQNQQLAYSNDKGRTWTKYAGNPVLDLGLTEFRDPKVFWYAPSSEWIMAAVLSDLRKVTFYGSKDLKAWHHLGDFGPAGAVDGAWECPDLFAVPVTNSPADTRWVLKVDVFKSTKAGGSGAQYFVGIFDGQTFIEEPGGTAQPVDYGKDFYAAASWSNIPASDGRHLWIGWMNNHAYAQDTPTAPWRGAMSVPRVVSLRRTGTGYEILQSPVEELARLRSHHLRLANVPLMGRHRTDSASTAIASKPENSQELLTTLCAGDAQEFGLKLRVGPHEQTVISYNIESQRLFIDRTHSGRIDFSDEFAGRQSAPVALTDGCISLHVLLDRSSVEVFAGNGERVLTEQIFPAATSTGLRAYAKGGTAVVRSLDLWDLAPMRPQ